MGMREFFREGSVGEEVLRENDLLIENEPPSDAVGEGERRFRGNERDEEQRGKQKEHELEEMVVRIVQHPFLPPAHQQDDSAARKRKYREDLSSGRAHASVTFEWGHRGAHKTKKCAKAGAARKSR